jgi:hypothetical protein
MVNAPKKKARARLVRSHPLTGHITDMVEATRMTHLGHPLTGPLSSPVSPSMPALWSMRIEIIGGPNSDLVAAVASL